MLHACKPIGWWTLNAVLATLLATGCGKSASERSAELAAAKPAAEQSFELIMETFKRRIEGTPSGFISKQQGARSRLTASNQVTSQVIPPAQEGEPYRAEVTVVSETRYSLQRPTEETDDSTKKDDDDRNNKRSGPGIVDNPADINTGLNILDPGLIGSTGDEGQTQQASPSKSEPEFSRRNDKEERTFKLEYKNGRWALMTKPDPKTERAIELAFEESLSTQI
ncbi:MAG: hypothetical protein WD468_02210 [Pirellulales bacterium]